VKLATFGHRSNKLDFSASIATGRSNRKVYSTLCQSSEPRPSALVAVRTTRFHDVANRIRRDRASRKSRPTDGELARRARCVSTRGEGPI